MDFLSGFVTSLFEASKQAACRPKRDTKRKAGGLLKAPTSILRDHEVGRAARANGWQPGRTRAGANALERHQYSRGEQSNHVAAQRNARLVMQQGVIDRWVANRARTVHARARHACHARGTLWPQQSRRSARTTTTSDDSTPANGTCAAFVPRLGCRRSATFAAWRPASRLLLPASDPCERIGPLRASESARTPSESRSSLVDRDHVNHQELGA